ncbi:MAG: rod shape-determining protein RodA [Bacillota bacterium]|nr:rod shape-determining protein RodA [Bacillota bacterium]
MFGEIKRLWRDTDKFMLLIVTFACLFGIIAILSATRVYETNKFVIVQGAAFIAGIVAMFAVMVVDYNSYAAIAKHLYIVSAILLIIVLFVGTGGDQAGSQSWIRFAGVGVQPSEIVKILFIITFAAHLSAVEEYINSPLPLLGLLAHGGFLIFLVLLQPDYGTALVYMFIFICMLFSAKISYKYLIGAICAFLPVSTIMWLFVLKPYQKDRFFNFLNPERDMLGTGYQVVQSKVAIGSGGIVGKGLFHGALVQTGTLPASHTDFIFSSIAEEMGLVGCTIVIGFLFCIIYKCIHTAKTARTSMGSYICIGVAAMFIFHVYENVGMCMGLMPVTGIPLPFFSSGGSSLVTNLIAVGLVMNVWSRRKTVGF